VALLSLPPRDRLRLCLGVALLSAGAVVPLSGARPADDIADIQIASMTTRRAVIVVPASLTLAVSVPRIPTLRARARHRRGG